MLRSFRCSLAAGLMLVVCCASPNGRSATSTAATNSAPPVTRATSTASAADELLRVDRNFSAEAQNMDLIAALANMFSDSVVMVGPGGHVFGRDSATALLKSNPLNATSHVSWHAIRVGISSDGAHGFTQGYITTTRATGDAVPGKFLAYWIKEAKGWRVAAYKRSGRPPGPVSLAMLPASLPAAAFPSRPQNVSAFGQEISSAERAFSDDVSKLGRRAGFYNWGHEDAVTLGGGPEWAVGRDKVADAVAASGGSEPIQWSTTRAIAAASGDLGVSIGYIHREKDPAGNPGQAFFTVWKRATPSSPWRYIAE